MFYEKCVVYFVILGQHTFSCCFQSYTLRICVLGMMCEVLITTLKGEGLSDKERTQRDEYLDDLYDHMHDLSVYVRHRVRKTMIYYQ